MQVTGVDRDGKNHSVPTHCASQLEQVLTRQFYSFCDGRYKLTIPLALALGLALWEVVPHGRISAWFIAVVISQALIQGLCTLFGRSLRIGAAVIYWRYALGACIVIDSLVFGAAGALLFPVGSMPHQFILSLVLAGAAGAAAVTCAAYLPSAVASIVFIMLPLCGTFFSQRLEYSLTMGAVLFLFAVGMVGAAAVIGKTLTRFLVLRIEKDILIQSLSAEKEKIEALNADMETEVLERKLITESLKRSEDRYRAVVEGQTEFVCRLSGNHGLSFFNEAFGRYFQVTSEDLLVRNFLEFVHPEDRESARDFFEQISRDSSSGMYEHRLNSRDGKILRLQWTYRALHDASGQVTEFQGVGKDITAQRKAEEALRRSHEELEQRVQERTSELREMNKKLRLEIADRIKAEKSLRDSEQRFRTIFEKARDCVFVKDRELRYSHLNPAMQAIFEASESDIVGSTDEELYGLDQAKRLKNEDLRVLGGQVIEAEHTLAFRGRELTFNCVKVPMIDASGHIVGLCGIARDITERFGAIVRRPKGNPEFKSSAMIETMRQVRLAAGSDSLILLLGESGSGKDFLARYVHHLSHRSQGPFFAINCAALAPELAESELFGHEAGSFTGARARKRGMMELAEGGTLLLNEIGELSLGLQAKLLTFLDTRSFTRVGGETNIEVNARIIAATNRELLKEVEARQFRHDLYHRLNVFCIQVPPLRERLEDLPLLVETIMSELCSKLGHGGIPRLDARCLSVLSEYHWPGNVRELRNVLERALIVSEGGKIRPEDIRLLDKRDATSASDRWFYAVPFPNETEDLNTVAKRVKSEMIKEALRRASGVKKDAAILLGISIDAFKHQLKSVEDELHRLDSRGHR
jgi:PAS domain S-box-containing protein